MDGKMNWNANRYSPTGDMFAQIESAYGREAAMRVYSAALVDDGGTQFRATLSDVLASKQGRTGYGPQKETSATKILGEQIYTDPLGAPIDAVGTVVKNAVKSATGNWGVWLLVAAGAVALFFYFGGSKPIRKWLTAKK